MRFLNNLFLIAALGVLLWLADEHVVAAPLATISLTVNNPDCAQSQVETGACYINLRNMSATGSDSSFDHVDVSINGKVRLRMQNFFESASYFSEDMLPQGLKVSCGGPNASGNPNYGKLYSVTIQPYMGTVLGPTDTANVYCPYFKGQINLPLIKK